MSKREGSLIDQSTGSQKKDTKKSSGSQTPRRTPKNKKNTSRQTPSTDDAMSIDNQQNKFAALVEDKSETTKILSSSANLRKDFYGNLIMKGRHKKQKVTWADKVAGNTFPTVETVESFKKYNVDVSAEKVDCNCACHIF